MAWKITCGTDTAVHSQVRCEQVEYQGNYVTCSEGTERKAGKCKHGRGGRSVQFMEKLEGV